MIEGAVVRLTPDEEAYDLEEALPGVSYLLAADVADGPLTFLRDARELAPEEVVALADAIESLPARRVHARLRSHVLAALPPFQGPLEDEDKEWLLAVLQGLMAFVRRAADDGAGLRVALRTPVGHFMT